MAEITTQELFSLFDPDDDDAVFSGWIEEGDETKFALAIDGNVSFSKLADRINELLKKKDGRT
jgi:hypothetical protein